MKEKQVRQSKPRVDLTGKKFGKLTPLYYIKGGKWHCKCDCGNECDIDTRNLNSNHTQSCGCLQKEKASKKLSIDMMNFENEHFKVIERDTSSKNGVARWKCICKHCGNIFTIEGKHLRAQDTTSCGCIHSKGEQKITKMLMDEGCTFSTQYTFLI